MRRGELYRVRRPLGDPRPTRVFAVVSRRTLVESRFPTVVCAPVLTRRHGLASEVEIGQDEGLKHACSIHCDALVSLDRRKLTDFVGSLPAPRVGELDRALRFALELE
jgi:mRNA interferase MazF